MENEEKMEIIAKTEATPLQILITDADKYGTDIAAMSNFFDGYINQLSTELRTNATAELMVNLPVADLGIINDVVIHAEAIAKGEYSLIPDFEHLPSDIRKKLKDGIYTVGESKQVDGNMRAVILDENKVRVKDITLTQVKNDPGTLETTRSISNQLQMRQIYAKLDDIQALQSYQIDRDRDRDMVGPFLDARYHILMAQNKEDEEERREELKKASDELTKAIHAAYTDMSTSSKHLSKMLGRPLFRNQRQINNFMGYLATDLQVATKFVGIQLHVQDYLGDTNAARLTAEGYQHVMHDFFTKQIGPTKQSAAMMLQMNYPYTKDNMDSWYKLQQEMVPVLNSGNMLTGNRPVYLVSVEGGEEV